MSLDGRCQAYCRNRRVKKPRPRLVLFALKNAINCCASAMSTSLGRALCQTLKKASDPAYAPSKAAYLKNVCQFYGLKAGAQKTAFDAHLPTMLELFQQSGKPAIYELSREMFASTVHEEKQCGYMILHYVLDKKPSRLGLYVPT